MIQSYQLLILLDYGSGWVWVIVYSGVFDYITQSSMFDSASKESRCSFIFLVLVLQVNLHGRSLDVLSHIDDFLESWNTQCHILS